MTASEAGGTNRFRITTPIAAVGGVVVAAIAGGVMLTTTSGSEPTSPEPAAVVASEPAPGAPPPGGELAGVQFDQVTTGAPNARPAATDMEIVVKYKDDAKVKDIVDAFWKDQASARAKFEAFKAGRPELAGLKLDRVTYSNELVLVNDGGTPADKRLSAMRDIAAKLKGAADVSYAEPNMTAHPGGQ